MQRAMFRDWPVLPRRRPWRGPPSTRWRLPRPQPEVCVHGSHQKPRFKLMRTHAEGTNDWTGQRLNLIRHRDSMFAPHLPDQTTAAPRSPDTAMTINARLVRHRFRRRPSPMITIHHAVAQVGAQERIRSSCLFVPC